jgi:thiosulfate/3-mercaptopyruvate sulfurtransferase
MAFRTLIDTATLAQHLGDRAVAIVDCRFKLDEAEWGERAFAAGHIPGATYAHLDRDLCGPKTGANGRHPLPDVPRLVASFERLGIGDGLRVVAYDQDNGMFASRLWWMLRWMGHPDVAVLDGGFAKWVAEGRPTSQDARAGDSRPIVRFTAAPQDGMTMDVSDVAGVSQSPDWKLIDARAPERYRGEVEPIDRVPGHIPGAANHFFMWNLSPEGTFLPAPALRARLRSVLGEVPADRAVCYCGSGVTACHDLLALEHAGLSGGRLYPGSWSEWSHDPARPVRRGDR